MSLWLSLQSLAWTIAGFIAVVHGETITGLLMLLLAEMNSLQCVVKKLASE